jgi:hypothetical protein
VPDPSRSTKPVRVTRLCSWRHSLPRDGMPANSKTSEYPFKTQQYSQACRPCLLFLYFFSLKSSVMYGSPQMYLNATHHDGNASDSSQLVTRMEFIDEQAPPEQEVNAHVPYIPNLETIPETATSDHSAGDVSSSAGGDDEEEPLLEPLTRCNEHPDFASREKVPWFLEEAYPESSTAKRLLWRSKRNTVLSLVTFLAVLIFLVNLITLRILQQKFPGGALLRGARGKTSAINTAIHVAVNIVSTVLLACSNLCMQLLVAPTRKDVDRAHARASPVSLDIGIPSFSNLRFISYKRALIWVLLGLASLPLHLL